MKKIYASALLMLSAFSYAQAAPGDTTVVQAHNDVQLSWYNNYDATASFPNGTTSYQKIVMEFQLGKYNCGGNYNPSNPGEGAGQTGWCADWDYDVHVIAMNSVGDTLEMGELITPYANSTFPMFPWTWKHSYYYDVTDFYPILKDDVTIRVFYSGYSGGFTATVKFHMIEGTPPRNVVGISKLWHGGFAYGNAADPIETKVAMKSELFPATAVSAETKVIITGHGGDNTQNCAEFCKKWYQYKINGNVVKQQDIWRDNCGANPISPQSGTWPINRANWCPGLDVATIIHKVPATVTPGQNFDVDMDFQTYTSGNNSASYKLSAIMFYYGAFNRAIDAGIESVISPTNDDINRKENPICGAPELMVKNYGSTTITSVTFEYGIEGGTMSTHTWNTSLGSMEEGRATLPSLASITETSGNNNKFIVRITQVNGATDENIHNNVRKTTFAASQTISGGIFAVNFKTSSNAPFGGGTNTTTWKLYNMSDNMALVTEKTGVGNGTVYSDTVGLQNGCYKLVVETPKGYGLSFFNYISTRGYVRLVDLTSGSNIEMPDAYLGSSGLEGNFGNGFTHYFRVVNATDVKDINKSTYSLSIFPNPAKELLNVNIYGSVYSEAKVQLINILGQVVYTENTKSQNITIATDKLPNGIYTLVYNTGDSRKTEKVVIAK